MGDVVPAVSPDKETEDAIKNFGDNGDEQALQVVYNKQSKEMENLMESLKGTKAEDRKAVEQKLQALNKAQSDLATFMTNNKIPVPASGFVDQVRSIRGWEEIFDTIHLMLGSDTICFKILQYAPLSSLPVENMKNIPPPEGVKIVELPNLPDLPDPDKLLEDVKPVTTEPAPADTTTPPADTTPPPADTTPPPDSTVVDPAKPPEKPAEEIPPSTPESVKKTWDDIRESIRTVLEATQTQVTTIQDVLSEVATLSKNYTTNFIPLIADEKNYGFAYKKIDLLKKPTESLNALVSVLDTQSTDHLQIVVGKGKVLLQQVGQKVLESTYKTISDCETKKQQEYASLTTVYNGYLEAMKYLSELKGQLAASKANVQFGEQTVEAYGKMKTVIQTQYDSIDSNKAKEVGEITSALQAASSKLDEQNKELSDKAQATADSIMKDVDNRRKELNDVIKGQQEDLNKIPLTRKTVKTVVKKHLWGLFSTSSNVEVDEANTMELDAQKKKIEITQDLQKQALDAGKDQLTLVMDFNKQQAALFTDKIKLLNDQALKDKSRLDSLYNEIKKELYDQIQDLNSKINATNLEVGKYTGSVTTLTAQIKDYEENAAGLKKNADQLAADMRARIEEYDKTIDSAKTQTNNILEHYGAQINSSPAVTATIELLGYLLGLPKSVTDTALSMVYFRFKVYRFVRDMQVGIEEIETGSKDIDSENDPALDVDRWQKWVASLGKGASWKTISQRMADDGVTYSILQDLSKEDYEAALKDYGITGILRTVFNGRIKDYQNLGSVARMQVSQGITRVFDQLKVLGAFATMISELTTAKDKGELAPDLENVDEKALVVANK